MICFLTGRFRVPHGPQNSVPEGMFDDSINLVVWGHEHDCRISPEPVAGKQYVITQPGSSVATSLAEGEAIEKYGFLLPCKPSLINLQTRSLGRNSGQGVQTYPNLFANCSTLRVRGDYLERCRRG